MGIKEASLEVNKLLLFLIALCNRNCTDTPCSPSPRKKNVYKSLQLRSKNTHYSPTAVTHAGYFYVGGKVLSPKLIFGYEVYSKAVVFKLSMLGKSFQQMCLPRDYYKFAGELTFIALDPEVTLTMYVDCN